MVESIIKQVFNAIIPAVHAAGVEWSPGDKDVWSRLKRATTREYNILIQSYKLR